MLFLVGKMFDYLESTSLYNYAAVSASYCRSVFFFLFYGFFVRRTMHEFNGDSLIIGCGKDGCLMSHPSQDFYSIDPMQESDVFVDIEIYIPQYVIPNQRFSFIIFENIPYNVICAPGSYALRNASSKLNDKGITLLKTGSGTVYENTNSLHNLIQNLKTSGFKYGINIVDYLFPEALLNTRIEKGICLFLTNDVDAIKPSKLYPWVYDIRLPDGTAAKHPLQAEDEIKLKSIDELAEDFCNTYAALNVENNEGLYRRLANFMTTVSSAFNFHLEKQRSLTTIPASENSSAEVDNHAMDKKTRRRYVNP